jgi:Coenzyme PQQ synthesis protein D (PqqD)
MSDIGAAASAAYHQHPQVLFTRLSEEEAVLLSLPAARYYTLNETGGVVWEALRDGATPAEVARALESEFDVGPAEALAHARAFVAELLGEGLVREESGGSA